MLLKKSVLDAIVGGEVTLQFRRWKRPTVQTGGTLKTAVGIIAIDRVEPVTRASLTERDARAAGFASRKDLLSTLDGRAGRLHRVALHYQGEDERVSLRKLRISRQKDMMQLAERLDRREGRHQEAPVQGAGPPTERARADREPRGRLSIVPPRPIVPRATEVCGPLGCCRSAGWSSATGPSLARQARSGR